MWIIVVQHPFSVQKSTENGASCWTKKLERSRRVIGCESRPNWIRCGSAGSIDLSQGGGRERQAAELASISSDENPRDRHHLQRLLVHHLLLLHTRRVQKKKKRKENPSPPFPPSLSKKCQPKERIYTSMTGKKKKNIFFFWKNKSKIRQSRSIRPSLLFNPSTQQLIFPTSTASSDPMHYAIPVRTHWNLKTITSSIIPSLSLSLSLFLTIS